MKEKENKRRNCGRPKLNHSEKLGIFKGSLEQFKIDFLKAFDDKKKNEKQIRDFVNFCANFAFTVGSYEKAIQIIREIYEINNSTNKQ